MRSGLTSILGAALCVWLAVTSPIEALACAPKVTVRAGDTLAALAREHLGSVFRYAEIHSANLDVIGSNPNRVRVGQELTIPCGALVSTLDWSRLPDARSVALLAQQTPVQVLDVRSAKAVAKGVIPGAVSIPFAQWRGPRENPGAIPGDAELSRLIGAAGIRLDAPVVLVGKDASPMSMGRTAFVYWILKSLGAERLAILRGGHANWEFVDLPVAAAPVQLASYPAELRMVDTWYARRDEVEEIAEGRAKGALLDARPERFYRKRTPQGQSRPSTLPGALNSPAPAATLALTQAPSVEMGVLSVLERLKGVDVNWEAAPVVTFCDTGELSALNWFYASELSGIRNVKLYPESARGWKAGGGKLAAPPPVKSKYDD